jgi:hypothetical protein
MIYFDSDMSKSTNMVVCFDWKTVIYIYVCGKCRTQFMLLMEKSVTFTGACVNEIIPSINRLFVYKAKEGRHVRICNIVCDIMSHFISTYSIWAGKLHWRDKFLFYTVTDWNIAFCWYPCHMLPVELCEPSCKSSSLPVDRKY